MSDADARCRRRSSRPPITGLPRPIIDGRQLRLHDAHHHAEEAEQRADREVDVAGDDDEHHARRHDGDRGGLDREVEEVARREEAPAGERGRTRSRSRPARRPCRAGAGRARAPGSRRRCRRTRLRRSQGRSRHGSAGRARSVRSSCGRALGREERRRIAPPVSISLLADGGLVARHALAERFLGDPAGVDHDVEVVLGDRHRLQEDRVHLVAARAS